MKPLLLFVLVFCSGWMSAQSDQAVQAKEAALRARQWRVAHERAIIDEFTALLAIPNVARNLDDMRRNAAHIRAMMDRRGIRNELFETAGGPPAIFGELRTPGATQTLVFYVHYDGQPVEPAQWSDGPPFQPLLRNRSIEEGGRVIALPRTFDPEARLYARSASDDKAPIVALFTALDALRAANLPLRSNVKFFFDGEEEAGSPHLEQVIRANADKLRGDVWIFCDGPIHQSRRQQVVFGVRGSTGVNLTVYGARRELHSGHYGNWAPNPALLLARLVASMRDEDGRILIPGFYDDVEPLSEAEKKALAELPDLDRDLRRELWLAGTEGAGRRIEELINLPALNIRGLQAAGVDAQSRNVVPAQATVSIDIRLVKGMDHRRAVDKLVQHVRSQGYHIVDRDPDEQTRLRYPKICKVTGGGGYNAVKAAMDSPMARKIVEAVRAAHSTTLLMPTLGGSLPIAPIEAVLQTPVIIVPIANHDNNQHGHNENIRLQNLWDGMETMAALLVLR
jgi:acetylornithine deacetylase/succinyl-diaminopimelate desuccinylase-like protein